MKQLENVHEYAVETALIGTIFKKSRFHTSDYYAIRLHEPYHFTLVDEAPSSLKDFEIATSKVALCKRKDRQIAIPEGIIRAYILEQYNEMYRGAHVKGSAAFVR